MSPKTLNPKSLVQAGHIIEAWLPFCAVDCTDIAKQEVALGYPTRGQIAGLALPRSLF